MQIDPSDTPPPPRLPPSDFQRRVLWVAVTAVSMLAIGAVGVYFIRVIADVLQFLQPVLVPIAFAGILAYLLEPIIKKLTDRGTPRFRAMMLVWVGFHMALLLLFLSVAVPTISSVGGFVREQKGGFARSVTNLLSTTMDGVDQVIGKVRGEDPRKRTEAALKAPPSHTVHEGETLANIAATYGITPAELAAANPERKIEPGAIMALPENAKAPAIIVTPPTTHLVGERDTLAKIAANYRVTPVELETANVGRKIEPGMIISLPANARTPGSSGMAATVSESWVRAKLNAWVSENGEEVAARVTGGLSRSFQGILGLFGYLVGFLLVPVYLYYFLKESAAIQKGWSNYIPLRASSFRAELVDCLNEINGYLIAFFRGQMLVSMIDGLLVGVSLAMIGLPYAMLIGVFVALLGLIPYVGNLLCLLAACGVSVAHFGKTDAAGDLVNTLWGIQSVWAYPLIVAGIFIVVQQINSLVTAPKIVGDAVGLHPLTVIFSVLFWSLLIGGLLGALLAVPLTASVKVILRRYVWERRVQLQLSAPQDYPVS